MTVTLRPDLEALKQEAARRVPPVGGTLKVKGLDGPVTVVRDKHGVPHARVPSAHDVWFVQGFLHAQDRLWGMERTRRFFHGTLSEIVGEGGLSQDRLYRRVGIMRAARREWPQVEKAGREVVEAYVAGVNAYLDLGFPLPIEFEILGYTPARWDPTDVTGRWKLICYSQSMNGQAKLGRLRLLQALGPDLFSRLFPYYPEDAPVQVPPNQPGGERPLAELMKLFEEAHARSGILESNGSNCWAVDGALSATGKPLVAGDPHLAISVPSFWHVQHIAGPDFSFIGATMPGVPGATYYGHNGRVAWAITTAGADAQDLFLEDIRAGDPPQYRYQGEWREARVHVEEIRIKGKAEPVVERVLETHHGPIVSGESAPGRPVVALSWVGSEVQQTFSSFPAIHSAGSVEEMIEAHRLFTSHNNRIFADDAGNIAYLLSGQIPLRKGGPAHFAVPGWTGDHEWLGFVPFDEMPRAVNPPHHFLNSSNNRIVSYDYPHYIAPEGRPFRAQRVAQVLAGKQRVTAEDFARLHGDRYNILGARVASRSRRASPITEAGRRVQAALEAWDGYHHADAAGGAAFEVLLWKLSEGVLGRLRAGLGAAAPGDETFRSCTEALAGLLLKDDTVLLSHPALAFRDWDHALSEALDAAGGYLEAQLGPDPSAWSWGALHKISFRHGIGREEPAASLLNAGSFPSGGSGATVNAANHPGGPSLAANNIVTYRQIIDLADPDASLFVVPPGQSGHPASPHYADLLEDYLNVRYRPLLWSRERIKKETEAEQTLEP